MCKETKPAADFSKKQQAAKNAKCKICVESLENGGGKKEVSFCGWAM